MSKLLAIFVIGTFAVYSCHGALEDKVAYHEVLHMRDVHTRTRRSIEPNQIRAGREIRIRLFNMTLTCHLYPRKDLFTPTFRLVIVDGNKKREVNDFNKEQFLVGTCEGDAASDVHGYFTNGVFEGSITYDGEVYGIEEAKRHLQEKKAGEHYGKMIAYRSSDIIWDRNNRGKKGKGPSFCGAAHVDDPLENSRFGIKAESKLDAPSRGKRASTPYSWSTCRLIAVADYKFYRFIGGSDIYNTAAYIGSVMERVDSIYRGTTFNIGYDITGMGFEIAEMQIYVNPTSGYNANQANWEPLKLLQMFGRDLYFKDFCLAHLFTHQQFSGNVLGLAYIASESQGSAGGICSPTRSIEGQVTALNTGWSTTLNSNTDTVLAQQAQLVTTHELGHNWGSEHDPDTDSCSPSSMFGNGKYLMYAYSVNGYDSNNNKFSTCSRRDIGVVLASKAKGCFSRTPDETSTCGNGLIDPEEECDAGYLGKFGLDPCCSSQCFLVSTATCSPVNHECCENCQMAGAGFQCLGDNDVSCYNASSCNGVSLSCPTPPNKHVGSPCLDLGLCDGQGTCNAFCEARGKVSCTCDRVGQSCQRCCRDNATSECKPFDNNHPLPNSRPCVIGYCLNGVCQKSEVSLINRLFNIFDSLTVDGILKFFRDNLVGSIMVFSLIIWIPISCCITYQDRKQRKGLKREVGVDLREDRDFLYDEDGRRVPRQGGPMSSTPRTPRTLVPRRLPPLMSPRNQQLVQQRNRIMPMGDQTSSHELF
ncbi:ADAM 17-like protease [Littorina saxatilis]|uniref:ADAM 17-like protease n=1 Tax=Littorina saxatilis TaxID=31220 RepID=UPI0038B51E0B